MIEFCLCVSLACAGFYVAMNGTGMILNGVANWLTKYLPEFVRKPLFECLPCMSSVWVMIFWLAYYRSFSFNIIPAILITCGINSLIAIQLQKLYGEHE